MTNKEETLNPSAPSNPETEILSEGAAACVEPELLDPANGPDLEQRCQKAEEEAKRTFDRFLRLSAEFDNYKKRTAREMEDYRKYAYEAILGELLGVVDNLERAIVAGKQAVGKDDDLLKGIELTLKEILRIFEKFSVTPVNALGKTFDPNYHQAVMQEQADHVPQNTVTKEFQKGYLLHDRLLRPAMVAVSNPKK